MPGKNTQLSLRVMVTTLNAVRRAGYQEGTQQVQIFTEPNPTLGRGTPSRPSTPYDARSPRISGCNLSRQYGGVSLAAHATLPEAIYQLCRVMEPHRTLQAAGLALSVGEQVEKERILASFSSAVAAVACIQVSALSLKLEPLLGIDTLHRLGILPNPVRIAYNHLWMQRGKLEGLIWLQGGHPCRLRSPTLADGSLDAVMFRKGAGLPPFPPTARQLRPVNFQTRGSLLRLVTYPSEQDEQF